MKRRQSLFLSAIAVILLVAGAFMFRGVEAPEEDDRVKVLASFYPLAYYAEQIGGEFVKVSTLIPPNSEVHSWQPSISDIISAEEADIIIYNGAGLDHWVEDDILEIVRVQEKTVVEASEGITLLEPGEPEEEDDHGHEEGDPHVWVSPYTAGIQAEKLYNALVQVDPEHTAEYTENWNRFKARLDALDQRYLEELKDAPKDVIFTTHSAYGYLSDRYGFHQHGVIGLSADEQPSTQVLSEIIEEMIHEETYVIYVDPVYSIDYAETLKVELEASTGETVQVLDLYLMLGPLNGLDFIGQMEVNLENLKAGLLN